MVSSELSDVEKRAAEKLKTLVASSKELQLSLQFHREMMLTILDVTGWTAEQANSIVQENFFSTDT